MFDIIKIRDQLNEVAFHNGKRSVCIGLISELFADQESEVIETELQQLEQQLNKRDLLLERPSSNRDQLHVAQQLKTRQIDLAWMAQGIQWVAKITTVALEMVVPAVIGSWLDQRLGTQFLVFVGLVFGVPLGMWHLIKMTKRGNAS